MKLLFVHAHFDDFEFSAAGTFELWRRRDPSVERRVLVCTDGAAGHHAMTRADTSRRRLAEQDAAARLGGFDFRQLRDAGGQPFREARLHAVPGFLPALWQEIRAFEPDYLFCPPVPTDPLAGVHVDHLDVAHGVRSVAYLINVPHAFSPEYPADETRSNPVRTPVIVNTYDGYLAVGHRHDLAVDISPAVEFVAELAWCHESQLREWLPWVNRHGMEASQDLSSWRRQFVARLEQRKQALDIEAGGLFEVFQVTAWGTVPTLETLLADFPSLVPAAMPLKELGRRLDTWRVAAGG